MINKYLVIGFADGLFLIVGILTGFMFFISAVFSILLVIGLVLQICTSVFMVGLIFKMKDQVVLKTIMLGFCMGIFIGLVLIFTDVFKAIYPS